MYQVIPDDSVFDQVAALPTDALASYAEAMTVLQLAPWNGRPYNEAKPDGIQELVFAGGFGTITYLILEDQREVHVLVVQYAG